MYKNESEPHTEALPAEPERLLATKVIQEFIRTDRLWKRASQTTSDCIAPSMSC